MRRVAILGLALVAVLALTSPTLTATARDTLIIGTTDKITELSPENSYDYWTWHVYQQVGDFLVSFKPGTTQIVPSLATSWTVSPDGKTYTFILRRGVVFTDGAPVNAQAVKFSFDRALKLKGPDGASGLISGIQKIDVVNPSTVRFTLKERDATFLSRLTETVGISMIVSPKTTPANEFAKGRFAGSGPYRIASYTPGQRMVYEANPRYWGRRPPMRRVIEIFFANSQALAAAVESGQVDIGFRSFNPDDVKRLSANAKLTVIHGPMPSVRYIVFNVPTKPFDDARVRRAIGYAVDRERITRDVFAGINSPLYSMVPPGMWSHIDAFPKRNLDTAKKLLAEAGYSSSTKLAVTLWFSPSHYGDTEADVTAVLKSSIEETGMATVEVKSLEWGEYTKAMGAGQFGMFLLGWFPDFVDPDNFLSPWLVEAPDGLGTYLHKATSERDKAYYEQFKTLLAKAKATADQSARSVVYKQGQTLLAESAILVPLWQNQLQGVVVTQKTVKGIVMDLTTTFRDYLVSK